MNESDFTFLQSALRKNKLSDVFQFVVSLDPNTGVQTTINNMRHIYNPRSLELYKQGKKRANNWILQIVHK